MPVPTAPHGSATAAAAAPVVPIGGIEGGRRVITVIIGIIAGIKGKRPQKATADRLAGEYRLGGKCHREQYGDAGEQSKDLHKRILLSDQNRITSPISAARMN